MNAAARLVHQHTLSHRFVLTHLLSRAQALVLMIALSIVTSALGIIYITHSHRVFYADYQRSLTDYDKLKATHAQLLLEQSTQLMQASLQHVAEKKLEMVVPDYHSTVVIKE